MEFTDKLFRQYRAGRSREDFRVAENPTAATDGLSDMYGPPLRASEKLKMAVVVCANVFGL
jgi:hypothetical protein